RSFGRTSQSGEISPHSKTEARNRGVPYGHVLQFGGAPPLRDNGILVPSSVMNLFTLNGGPSCLFQSRAYSNRCEDAPHCVRSRWRIASLATRTNGASTPRWDATVIRRCSCTFGRPYVEICR